MKLRIILLLLFFNTGYIIHAQTIAYTGGNGSGYTDNQSAIITCPMFYGDTTDGSASNYSHKTICPMFFGGTGYGYDSGRYQFCEALLPLKILDFSGVKEVNRNRLYWRIANPHEVRWFEVERSRDGMTFVKIGIAVVSGIQYQFVDDAPIAGINYYRLRVVELNNQFSFSGILVLRSFTGSHFSVFPNPAKGHANLYCYSEAMKTGVIDLYDTKGRLVLRQSLVLQKGSNYFILHLEKVPLGAYVLKIDVLAAHLKLIVQ